ncbi:putative Glucan endo-1,3-beta-glucosidase A1 [Hypsibius exemplaris]|uniref:Glucan endo-1,3-beta-glucosidase A1 n=1 Tax=Hypsibius exemplaris TaxID=2072580 RepID=A0A1W0WNY2_HYPEX|nr:putative Glucan endo-1,3-beta-glucosidase A1 [Hypsibius exemplaris]
MSRKRRPCQKVTTNTVYGGWQMTPAEVRRSTAIKTRLCFVLFLIRYFILKCLFLTITSTSTELSEKTCSIRVIIDMPICGFLHLLAVCAGLAVATQTSPRLNYIEIFRDDFNGGYVDATRWNRANVASTVNEELQYYAPDEVWQADGLLNLRSQKRSHGGRDYTSGRIDTKDKFNFTYGDVEWRAKLPTGQGIWPALWLLRGECPVATPCPIQFWPPEIDVMEARGDKPHKVQSTLHFGVYPNNGYVTNFTTGPDYTADFHTYKVLWDPDQVVFYVDGEVALRVTDKRQIPAAEPMILIMNTAVGGLYSGNPDSTTPFPQNFVIDYVSVHRWQ